MAGVTETLEAVFGGHKCVVLNPGMSLDVYTATGAKKNVRDVSQ
jgi:hypothetical protein